MDTNLSKKLSQICALASACSVLASASDSKGEGYSLALIRGLCLAAIIFYNGPTDFRGKAQEDLGNYFWRLLAKMYCAHFSIDIDSKSIEFEDWAKWAASTERTDDESLSFIDFNRKGVTLQ